MLIEMNAEKFGDAVAVEAYYFNEREAIQILVGKDLCLTLNRRQARNLREGLTRLFPQRVEAKNDFDVSTYSSEGGKL